MNSSIVSDSSYPILPTVNLKTRSYQIRNLDIFVRVGTGEPGLSLCHTRKIKGHALSRKAGTKMNAL